MTNIVKKIKALDINDKVSIRLEDDGYIITLIFNNLYELNYTRADSSYCFGIYFNLYKDEIDFNFNNFQGEGINKDFDVVIDTTKFLQDNKDKIINILNEASDD